jgi:hypothetical protein
MFVNSVMVNILGVGGVVGGKTITCIQMRLMIIKMFFVKKF